MILAFMPVASAWADDAAPSDFRGYVDQAKFFVKRSWYADAEEQLELAVATDDGRLDPEAWFLLAQVRYELADLHGARVAADRALVNSREPTQTDQAAELLWHLTETFGWVTLDPGRPGIAMRLDLELQSVIFDPELKRYFNDLQAKLEGRITLPITVGLPTGAYTVNGAPVDVVAGQDIVVAPGIRSGALQRVELEVGVGLTAWLGGPVAHLLPAPTTSASVSLPVGPVVVGAIGQWSYGLYPTRDGALVGRATSWAAGGRVGVELPGTAPLVLRPSVGWRYHQVPGVELACDADGDAFVCAPDRAAPRLFVYPVSGAHVPFVEVAALVADRSRSRGFGGGLTVSGGYALGRVAPAATATTLGGASYAWTADDRAWTAWTLQVLADLTYAF